MLDKNSLSIIDGWLSDICHCASPNFNQRPLDTKVDLLVVHNISLPPGQFNNGYIEDFFCNRLDATQHLYFEAIAQLKVSAHCLIKRNGEIIQFVNFNERAWHAGASIFEGRDNCNDYSIGVELEGTDTLPYTPNQYQQLKNLSDALMQYYPSITPARITGHNTIAPERKTDPGASFNWDFFLNNLTLR
jgi:AmpD protein